MTKQDMQPEDGVDGRRLMAKQQQKQVK